MVFDSKAWDTPTQQVKIYTVPYFILELLNLIPLLYTFVTDLRISLTLTSTDV